jgi:hypothetical protein
MAISSTIASSAIQSNRLAPPRVSRETGFTRRRASIIAAPSFCARPLGARFDHRRLARFPIERYRSIDKKSRKIKTLERILIEQAYQLVRNAL